MKVLWFSLIIYIVYIFTIYQAAVLTVTDTILYTDPEYLSDESKVCLVNKDIKNEIYTSLSIIKTLPNSSMAHIEVLMETDGQYKIFNDLDNWMLMCELIDEPVILGKIFRKMGFTGCPVQPGIYSNPSYVVLGFDGSHNPPGNYIARLQVEKEDHELLASIEVKLKVEG